MLTTATPVPRQAAAATNQTTQTRKFPSPGAEQNPLVRILLAPDP